MQGPGQACEQKSDAIAMNQMRQALHDLCQPLTALQCRLELAPLGGTDEDYREAVQLGLVECGRLMQGVEAMQRIVLAARGKLDAADPPSSILRKS